MVSHNGCSASVISVGSDGDAVLPCRLSLGRRPELSFSTGSVCHTESHPPMHFLRAHAHSYTCPRIFLLWTQTHMQYLHICTQTFSNCPSQCINLQSVLTPLGFMVRGFSANIIPEVWAWLNWAGRLCTRGRCLMWLCDLECMGRCDFLCVSHEGGQNSGLLQI